MVPLRLSRYFNPAVCDFGVFSCFTRQQTLPYHLGYLSTSASVLSKDNKDFKPNPVFINRNPRCLEQAAIAPKRQGWTLQYPTKNYYYKLKFEVTHRHTTAEVEHNTEVVVVSASTKEWAVKQGLYSTLDISAAKNIGRILADRCLQAGITQVFYDEKPEDINSEKMQVFLKALQDGQLVLEELDYVAPPFKPGIDYSKPNRVGEKKKWQDDYQIE
ncbi:hypothetical protein SNE40_002514 [Patella caerulea]|uniref:Large ribosomal subunit protein uL18m n=1 Tax=Patella caerulea TaxID=87958 RepID=A0AAN8K610_PATCE